MIKNHDTHSAQAIYEALLKDPDLEIKEGQTREEAAKIEAEFRARQYFNNMQALSLGAEPSSSIKSLINFVSTPVSWVSDILDLVKVDGGFGISDMTGAGAIGASGIIDIMHDLSISKVDVSIGIRFQQIFDVDKKYRVSHLHGLYGLNINIGKSITL